MAEGYSHIKHRKKKSGFLKQVQTIQYSIQNIPQPSDSQEQLKMRTQNFKPSAPGAVISPVHTLHLSSL